MIGLLMIRSLLSGPALAAGLGCPSHYRTSNGTIFRINNIEMSPQELKTRASCHPLGD